MLREFFIIRRGKEIYIKKKRVWKEGLKRISFKENL